MELSSEFWDKKTKVSYFLAVLVVIIHFWPASMVSYDVVWLQRCNNFIELLIRDSLASFAVPLFMILSGFLFFRNYSNSCYWSKLKRRIISILCPYLFWNVMMIAWSILYPMINPSTQNERFEFTLTNILKSVFLYKYNLQFWFIFNLILFVICSPLIYLCIKNNIIGSAVIMILLLLAQNHISIGLYSGIESMVFFFWGGYIGLHCQSLVVGHRCGKSVVAAGFIFAIMWMIEFMIRTGVFDLGSGVEALVLMLGGSAFWIVFDVLYNLPCKQWMNHSFLVYALHPLVSGIILQIMHRIVTINQWNALLYTIVAIIITLVAIECFCVVLHKISPKIFSIASGNR